MLRLKWRILFIHDFPFLQILTLISNYQIFFVSPCSTTHCPRVVSTRQVRHSQFFSIFGRLWPRQECPCWPTNFKGGQFLSTNFTFVTWLYITKYFKMHHGIMPRPCLIMFLSKCDQEKHFHVACLGWEVGIFCPLSPLLLRYHISLS